MAKRKNPAAVALGRLGGKKAAGRGAKVRFAKMTAEERRTLAQEGRAGAVVEEDLAGAEDCDGRGRKPQPQNHSRHRMASFSGTPPPRKVEARDVAWPDSNYPRPRPTASIRCSRREYKDQCRRRGRDHGRPSDH